MKAKVRIVEVRWEDRVYYEAKYTLEGEVAERTMGIEFSSSAAAEGSIRKILAPPPVPTYTTLTEFEV